MSGRPRLSRNVPRLLAGSAALLLVAACLESSIVQVGVEDIAELRVTPDSTNVAIGRTLQAHALPLDGSGTLLVGLEVAWATNAPAIATVDASGLISGMTSGTARIIASASGFSDTAVVVVAPAPALVLSTDSVPFSAQAGQADPAPDTVQITNGGAFPLVGLAIDSIVYTGSTTGWLTAQLAATVAPTGMELIVATSGITTAGVYTATVQVSATDADGSPATVKVVLNLAAGAPATIELNDGDAQSGQVGAALATSPSVLVLDAFDNPVSGAVVTFGVTGGGGSVTGSPDTTDASGIARVGSWVLGGTKGPNALSATLASVGTVPFTATGVPGPATKLQLVTGSGQSAVAGSPVSTPPSVVALDAFDNGIVGVGVIFSIASGGGNIANGVQTTDASGVATVGSWTLGAMAGVNSLRAVAASIPDTVAFTATGLPGGIDQVLLVAGDVQIDTVAATLSTLYSVKVEDVNNNGIPGIPISWQVTAGGGTITATSDTDAGGVAVATRVLGNAPGTHTARALFGGAPDTINFTATANVGTASKLVVVTGTGQSATVNTNVSTPPSVKVTDKFDNPIAGHSVSFAVKGVAATISPTGAMLTLADGTATLTSWKLGTKAATLSDTVEVTPAGGVTPALLRFTATATPGAATSFQFTQGSGQTAITGSNVTTAPTVRIADTYGNGIAGRTVNFSASGSGSVGSASPVTNANGQASTTWNVNVTGHSMGANGTFQNTLTASTAGFSAVPASGFARYSYPTHVNPIFSCGGCHDFGGSSGGLNFDGTPDQDRAVLLNVVPNCDATLPTKYRRVSNLGGVAASDTFSILVQKLDPDFPGVGTCGAHGGGEYPMGAIQLTILRAWIRNGAPNN